LRIDVLAGMAFPKDPYPVDADANIIFYGCDFDKKEMYKLTLVEDETVF
jgi:hypothetical protein